jgi:tetratricopeptide (TPR) repeat protein
MKRILYALLTSFLALAFCASASAATAYTHPTVGFHLEIPEGWLPIDSTSAEETVSSGRVSLEMATVITSILPILDGSSCVYLFKESAAKPPFVNVSVDYRGDQEEAITVNDLLTTSQAYETYYLETQDQFPGYTVTTSAGAEETEGWYSMGYLGGVYEKGSYRIALAQVFVAAGMSLYEFTLTAEESDQAGATDDFSNLIGSFIAPGDVGEEEKAQADEAVLAFGAELTEAEDYEGVLAHFNAAIALYGDVAEYYAKRGEALYRLGRYQEMADSYSEAIAQDASRGQYYNERGVAYFYLEQWDAALADFRKAVDLNDPDKDAYINLSYLQKEMGNMEDSVLTCASGLAIYPENGDLLGILGDAHFALGNYHEALAAYDKLLAMNYCTAEDIPNYAVALESAGKQNAATVGAQAASIPAEPGDIVGVWRLSSVEMGGVSYNASDIGVEVTMKLNADETAVLNSSVDDDMPGSWAIQDGRVTITSQDGTAVVLALIDGDLCGEMEDGSTMVFSK